MRPQNVDIEEKGDPKRNDLSQDSALHSSVNDALLIAAIYPTATQFLAQGAVDAASSDAVLQTASAVESVALTAGHGLAAGSAALVHSIADAGELVLHAVADFGASAMTLGAAALHGAAEAGSTAMHALVEGGSAAFSVAADVGGAIVEHGGAALVSIGEAVVHGGAAVVAGAVVVGEFVGELASAVS